MAQRLIFDSKRSLHLSNQLWKPLCSTRKSICQGYSADAVQFRQIYNNETEWDGKVGWLCQRQGPIERLAGLVRVAVPWLAIAVKKKTESNRSQRNRLLKKIGEKNFKNYRSIWIRTPNGRRITLLLPRAGSSQQLKISAYAISQQAVSRLRSTSLSTLQVWRSNSEIHLASNLLFD